MFIERIGDGDPNTRIRISEDELGTITLQIIQFNASAIISGIAEIQFKKGGLSPTTYEILPVLIEAIEKDNKKGYFPFVITYDPPWPNEPE